MSWLSLTHLSPEETSLHVDALPPQLLAPRSQSLQSLSKGPWGWGSLPYSFPQYWAQISLAFPLVHETFKDLSSYECQGLRVCGSSREHQNLGWSLSFLLDKFGCTYPRLAQLCLPPIWKASQPVV